MVTIFIIIGRNCTKAAFFILALLVSMLAGLATSQASDADLAKKLSNPIASLISVPIVYDYDSDIGPVEGGSRSVVKFQPVIPFSLNADWNIISRTIVPIVDQHDIFPSSGHQFGFGDSLQNFFFSPTQPTDAGVIWGVGPVFLLPTATDKLLGGEKWGLGPTGVALVQRGPWTFGALANHIWSIAGNKSRADINNTFIQPFVSYTTPDAWTFALNTEATYNWNTNDWAVPINAQVSKLVVIGKQPVSFGGGVRYWADSALNGPKGWGATFNVKFLFPIK